MLKKKIWSSFQRIIELFTQKFVTALKNVGLGSGIRKNLFPDPDPGVKKAPDPGSVTLFNPLKKYFEIALTTLVV